MQQLPSEITKTILLISGGIDSAIMLRIYVEKYGVDNLLSMYINLGNVSAAIESNLSKKLAESYSVDHIELKFSGYDELLKGYTKWMDLNVNYTNDFHKISAPGRSQIMYSLASVYADINGYDNILLGISVNEGFAIPAAGIPYIVKYNELLKMNVPFARDMSIFSPFANITKDQELLLLKSLDGNLDLLTNTITCWLPDNEGVSCGECPACDGRLKLFKRANEIDRIKYKQKL